MHMGLIIFLVLLAIAAILFVMCLRSPSSCEYCSAIDGYAHHPGCQKYDPAVTPKPTPCTCPERPDLYCVACGH